MKKKYLFNSGEILRFDLYYIYIFFNRKWILMIIIGWIPY